MIPSEFERIYSLKTKFYRIFNYRILLVNKVALFNSPMNCIDAPNRFCIDATGLLQ